MRRIATTITILVLCLSLIMSGCSNKTEQTDNTLSIWYEDAEVSSVEIPYGTTDTFSLTVTLSAENDNAAITWSSDDAGVCRVRKSSGDACTFSILKTGSAVITVECGDAKASVRVKISKNQDHLMVKETALTIDGERISVEKINLTVAIMYADFVEYYGDYASYYGLDTSTGLSGLSSQSCDYSSDGTWLGYFLEQSISQLQQYYAVLRYAEENGIALEDDELQQIQDALAAFEESAAEAGYENADQFAAACFGTGATVGIYEWYLELSALAEKAYTFAEDSLTYTDEAIAAHYIEMGYENNGENDYPVASMRHILIMAEADENGEHTEAAISAAHERAEELYQQWLSGEADEYSFIELANTYSEDGGSNTIGGLYENIYKGQMVTGIDDYLFANREYGDTAIIDNNGSYTGTHIVFFTGYGELYSTYLSLSDLKSVDMEAWLTELVDSTTLEYGDAYEQAGVF